MNKCDCVLITFYLQNQATAGGPSLLASVVIEDTKYKCVSRVLWPPQDKNIVDFF